MMTRKATDICIDSVSTEYREYAYRAPMKFGGRIVDRVTLLNVNCTVRTRGGQRAVGFGSMPLSNVWSFPSATVPEHVTLAAMKHLADSVREVMQDYNEFGHPIEISSGLEPLCFSAAADLTVRLQLKENIPALCTLVTVSAFDAALHDAFGKAHAVNCYHTYGPEFMNYDLSRYLGRDYQGEYPNNYILEEPRPRMPVYHLISAVDPIDSGDVSEPIGDGLPQTLSEWIRHNGLTHFKIKLNGNDRKWDVERVLRIDGVTSESQRVRGVSDWVYSLDFNEKCPDIEYLVEVLTDLRDRAPDGYRRIQYVEQPTARDLRAHPERIVGKAAKLKPVVIDESLTGIEELILARKMGYTGAALKACKGQSHMMVIASAAEKQNMFLCVQDLTCPGASLIQSASLAAHVPCVTAIEANARQYVPAANEEWEARFPGLFKISDGTMDTSGVNGPGLGAV